MVQAKLFDTLLEPLFILDSDGGILYCNEAAALIADIGVRKIIRSKVALGELFSFAEPVQGLDRLTEISDPTPYQEVSFKNTEGKAGRVQLTIQKFNEDPSWIVFFRDVTLEETLQRKYRAELEKKEDVIRDLEKAQAKLEDYSRNLEKMVEERTAQLSQMNQKMSALLDSLDEGFLIFDAEGRCMDVASRACTEIFRQDPKGQTIFDVLRFSGSSATAFKKWMTTAFAEMLPFEDLSPLAPQRFNHPEGREISLSYYPLRGESSIEGIVLVATDITSLVQAQKEAEKERAYAKMVVQMVKHKRQLRSFMREAEILGQSILGQIDKPEPHFEETFRALHTLKGGAASFSVYDLVDLVHKCENLLTEWNETRSIEKLTEFRVLAQTIPRHVQEFSAESAGIVGGGTAASQVSREIGLNSLLAFYQSLPADFRLRGRFFEQFLLEPVGPIFEHYNEILQDVARTLDKNVGPFVVEPADLKIFAPPYENLFSTFIHAFRNAVDHGIESPADREINGKPSAGSIGLRCEKTSDQKLRFTIWDDGGGIDPKKIREKLKEKRGLETDGESDEEVIQHIFDADFSTREVVTELSGRGVGMDAIKIAAEDLGGKVHAVSQLGHGTKVIIEVPWFQEIKTVKTPSAA